MKQCRWKKRDARNMKREMRKKSHDRAIRMTQRLSSSCIRSEWHMVRNFRQKWVGESIRRNALLSNQSNETRKCNRNNVSLLSLLLLYIFPSLLERNTRSIIYRFYCKNYQPVSSICSISKNHSEWASSWSILCLCVSLLQLFYIPMSVYISE